MESRSLSRSYIKFMSDLDANGGQYVANAPHNRIDLIIKLFDIENLEK